MKTPRILGFLLLLAGIVLQPLGWMYATALSVVSFAAIVAGVFLVYAGRGREEESLGGVGIGRTGREMPGDIHGHSGQLSGGRFTAWQSDHSSDGGGAGD